MRLLAIATFSLFVLLARGAPAQPVFMTLPAITIPVFEGDKVARQASVVLALELEKGHNEADVAPLKPRLMDAYIADLTALFEARAYQDRIIEPASIKPKLLETSQRVLGKGIVKDVLIQQAFERARRQ